MRYADNLKLKGVYDYIKLNQRLPSNTMKDSTLAYYTRILINKGLVRKIGYGVWKIVEDWSAKTTSNYEGIGNVKQSPPTQKIRGHGFRISIDIPNIKLWEKREDYFKKINYKFDKIPQGQSVMIRDFKVWFCNNSLVIHFPKDKSVFSSSAFESQRLALKLAFDVVRSIENKFNIKLGQADTFKFRISRKHFGDLENEIAKKYHKEGKQLTIYGDDGKQWLVIDFSWKMFIELEAVHPDTAVKDMDEIITPFMNTLRLEPKVLDTLKSGQTIQEVSLNNLKNIVLELAKQVKTQQDLLKGTQETVYITTSNLYESIKRTGERLVKLENHINK